MNNLKTLLSFFLLVTVLTAQSQSNMRKGKLRLLYLPIERTQIAGNIDVNLPTHFHHLRLFDSNTRFAPDEPSSFSSLSYTFWQKEVSEKLLLESGLGFFRNHTKGDFVPIGEEAIHFGLGNSQVGLVIDFSIAYIWKEWSLGAAVQAGCGPHFSRWDSWNNQTTPDGWGVVGFGGVKNLLIFLGTPTWWNRWSFRALVATHYSYSSYKDFQITKGNGEVNNYEKLKFSNRSKRPVFSISLGFDLQKNK